MKTLCDVADEVMQPTGAPGIGTHVSMSSCVDAHLQCRQLQVALSRFWVARLH